MQIKVPDEYFDEWAMECQNRIVSASGSQAPILFPLLYGVNKLFSQGIDNFIFRGIVFVRAA